MQTAVRIVQLSTLRPLPWWRWKHLVYHAVNGARTSYMRQLLSNSELYQYLGSLAKILEERHAKELSEEVGHASRTSAGNVSTEFLGESRIALRRVMKEERGVLTIQEREDVRGILRQLDEAFVRKGSRT